MKGSIRDLEKEREILALRNTDLNGDIADLSKEIATLKEKAIKTSAEYKKRIEDNAQKFASEMCDAKKVFRQMIENLNEKHKQRLEAKETEHERKIDEWDACVEAWIAKAKEYFEAAKWYKGQVQAGTPAKDDFEQPYEDRSP